MVMEQEKLLHRCHVIVTEQSIEGSLGSGMPKLRQKAKKMSDQLA
jgi:hypothetical protein